MSKPDLTKIFFSCDTEEDDLWDVADRLYEEGIRFFEWEQRIYEIIPAGKSHLQKKLDTAIQNEQYEVASRLKQEMEATPEDEEVFKLFDTDWDIEELMPRDIRREMKTARLRGVQLDGHLTMFRIGEDGRPEIRQVSFKSKKK